MSYPKGLIRYTTENELEGAPRHILRPRVVLYTLLLASIAVALLVGVLLRTPLELHIIRDRNVLYRPTEQGLVENVYILKIINMDDEPHIYTVRAEGIEGLQLKTEFDEVALVAGEVREFPVHVEVDPCKLTQQSTPIVFEVQAVDESGLSDRESARFLGPEGC